MGKTTDVRPIEAALYFLPVEGRLAETTLTCARVRLRVRARCGVEAEGWGESALNVGALWPGPLEYEEREGALKALCVRLAQAWTRFDCEGDAFEVGHAFQESRLRAVLEAANAQRPGREPVPWTAALGCCSAFDLALHDAWGNAARRPVFEMYTPDFMNQDLAAYLEPGDVFSGKWPGDYLAHPRPESLWAWHLVSPRDMLSPLDEGQWPDDHYPVLLEDWIENDGLKCMKVRLNGWNSHADYVRLVQVGAIGLAHQVQWISAGFERALDNPEYVGEILDKVKATYPRIYEMILYMEEPVVCGPDARGVDVRSLAKRKPLFLDGSAHDWRTLRLGRDLGWGGVAITTSKTLTGALLSLCWAKAHGMSVMVHDLTHPMIAQVPHVLLAAHAGTLMGVEAHSVQLYPGASEAEARVHPGLYQRRDGMLRLGTVQGPGLGYRISEMHRELPSRSI